MQISYNEDQAVQENKDTHNVFDLNNIKNLL